MKDDTSIPPREPQLPPTLCVQFKFYTQEWGDLLLDNAE